MGSGLHARVPPASPCPWVAHPVSGRLIATAGAGRNPPLRPFGLAVAAAPPIHRLSLATTTHSSAHSTKGTPSRRVAPTLRPAGSTWFQALFHSPHRGAFHRSLTVLVHYRSPVVLQPWAVGRPASPRIPRVRRYSRASFTARPRPSPTGLSPAAVARSSSLRLTGAATARPLPQSPTMPSYPARASAAACATRTVWAVSPVRSPLLRGSSVLLGVLRCFTSPGAPRNPAVRRYDPARVAPFGDLWITSSQRFPRAFRRVGASFVGHWRLGIPHVLICLHGRTATARRRLAPACRIGTADRPVDSFVVRAATSPVATRGAGSVR